MIVSKERGLELGKITWGFQWPLMYYFSDLKREICDVWQKPTHYKPIVSVKKKKEKIWRGFLGGSVVEICLQCRRHGSDPWSRRSPWVVEQVSRLSPLAVEPGSCSCWRPRAPAARDPQKRNAAVRNPHAAGGPTVPAHSSEGKAPSMRRLTPPTVKKERNLQNFCKMFTKDLKHR